MIQQTNDYELMFIEPLSGREQEVLHVLAQGASNQEIAETLVIAPNTVKRHVQTILAKLGVHNRTHAIIRAQQLNLLQNTYQEHMQGEGTTGVLVDERNRPH